MQTATELQPRVQTLVAETLGLELDEVHPESRFFADLGGESIDVLDLQFRIDRELKCPVDIGEAFGQKLEVGPSGEVTSASLDWLKSEYPFLPVETLPRPVTPEGMRDLLTVESIAEVVAAELANRTS